MTVRTCLDCGIPTVRTTRCPDCERQRQRNRNAARGDRYGLEHRRLRRQWAAIVNSGTVTCARCHRLIVPSSRWHLDHLPDGSSHPAHARCNEAARANV
jgi:hypothetical protein